MKLSEEIKDRLKILKEDGLIDRHNELHFILPKIKQLEEENNKLQGEKK